MGNAKKPVSVRSLLARINRKMSAEGRAFERGRGRAVGTFMLIDLKRGRLDAEGLGIAQIVEKAKELGVLKPWEAVEKEV